jgi:hypothetical protein
VSRRKKKLNKIGKEQGVNNRREKKIQKKNNKRGIERFTL